MHNRQKVLYISLDYDDCGDILFDDFLSFFVVKDKELLTEEQLTALEQIAQKKITLAKECKKELTNRLKEKAQGYDVVKLLVGSKRQDIPNDIGAMGLYATGSCFKNFAAFCEEQQWIVFDKFLVADAHNKVKAGTAMENKYIDADYGHPLPPSHEIKIEIVKRQLEHIRKEYPHDDIDYIFLDDDGDDIFLKAIADEFKSSPLCEGIDFSTYKCDHYPILFENSDEEILTLHTHFPRKQHTLSTALMMSAMPAQTHPIADAEMTITPAPDNTTRTIEIIHAAEMAQEFYPARKFI